MSLQRRVIAELNQVPPDRVDLAIASERAEEAHKGQQETRVPPTIHRQLLAYSPGNGKWCVPHVLGAPILSERVKRPERCPLRYRKGRLGPKPTALRACNCFLGDLFGG